MKIAHCLALGAGVCSSCGDFVRDQRGGETAGSDTVTSHGATTTTTTTTTTIGPSSDSTTGMASTGGTQFFCALRPGVHRESIDVDGTRRELSVAVGQSSRAGPPAVLFAWHGFGQSADVQLGVVDAPTYWDDAIVVAPQGLPRTFPQYGDQARPGWQIALGEMDDRDLRLFDATVQWLTERGCLDPSRVYSTGFSNGGYFSNLLGCHRGDVLAAIAPVGGGGPQQMQCGPPVAVQINHSRSDSIVPFDQALASFEHWVGHASCSPDSAFPEEGCGVAPGCIATVEACNHGGGHVWVDVQAERIARFLQAQRG